MTRYPVPTVSLQKDSKATFRLMIGQQLRGVRLCRNETNQTADLQAYKSCSLELSYRCIHVAK